MTGRHRRVARARPIEIVDAHTGLAHLFTDEALEAARGGGHHFAACGRLVLPASLTVGPRRACWSCVHIPGQRLAGG